MGTQDGWQREQLPDFLIIGAQKSGTTSLHHYLSGHPDIYMSSPLKEPALFYDFEKVRQFYRRTAGLELQSKIDLIRNYMARDYRGERRFGDASTAYTMHNLEYGIARQICEARADMQLIYVLRNPLQRMVSHFLHNVRHGGVTEDLDAQVSHDPIYLSTSMYWRNLADYLKFFDAKQIHVLLFEDLVAAPQREFDAIVAWLGLDPHELDPAPDVYNAGDNRAQFDSTELRFTAQTYGRLMEVLADDVRALERWLGRGLGAWDVSPERWCRP